MILAISQNVTTVVDPEGKAYDMREIKIWLPRHIKVFVFSDWLSLAHRLRTLRLLPSLSGNVYEDGRLPIQENVSITVTPNGLPLDANPLFLGEYPINVVAVSCFHSKESQCHQQNAELYRVALIIQLLLLQNVSTKIFTELPNLSCYWVGDQGDKEL
ncbi:hypothetical protein NE237_005857 [Protea cynaroides]|uniref:Uncharacterized protein n=1 Tax=Protea cynaroides TaxID=273540 RepID=A0A9Q0KLA7_9MAGN|nr:hypothetical protein NE237_005857 [Protea cynaroides]